MIKLVLTDVDGCLTDGSVIYSPDGLKYKCFNMQDGMGVKLLEQNNILTGIISSDNSSATQKRMEDLNMNIIHINVKNKLDKYIEILKKYNLRDDEVAYFGDDIQDLDILKRVKISGAPNNAVENVKSKVVYVTNKQGGHGAFREFVEYIIKNKEEL